LKKENKGLKEAVAEEKKAHVGIVVDLI